MDTLQTYSKKSSIRSSSLPQVIDLFSGCGGLAYGFQSAGFSIGNGIDLSPSAVKTASYNLHWKINGDGQHIAGDITKFNGNDFIADSPNGYIVIGGPPCQAYSQIGRGKLRSLGKGRDHLSDSRGMLYMDFLRVALEVDARAIVMENVPEAVNYGEQNIPEEVCERLDKEGYHARWSILNSADYGVPQTRERLFVIAIKKSEGVIPRFPAQTHYSADCRANSYKLRLAKLREYPHYIVPEESSKQLPPWISVQEALSDLPRLFPTADSRYRLYELNILLKYASPPSNDYQQKMRHWGGEPLEYVSGHGYRKTLRDYRIFEKMNPEDNYIQAIEIAEAFLEQACAAENVTEDTNPERYIELKKKYVPPYDTDKFKDKWKRLSLDKPSHTLVAHLSVDTYSHIHPWEPRGISVREAARLQSFPDDFIFQCTMGDAFKQIGNAVPPLLSNAIANELKNLLAKKDQLAEVNV
ncbi:DNA cytosine methyltransferase [Paenibacillus catalpae]|uniref:DNA cytosine methyltransferase n=1 Tax=Paenibacillus catalpae TaxID=1045775 RepID=UPI001FE6F337|nr:DNA cytosine methyltransferase [Paenibacillus catalpae]